jgi:hypothetical protein
MKKPIIHFERNSDNEEDEKSGILSCESSSVSSVSINVNEDWDLET